MKCILCICIFGFWLDSSYFLIHFGLQSSSKIHLSHENILCTQFVSLINHYINTMYLMVNSTVVEFHSEEISTTTSMCLWPFLSTKFNYIYLYTRLQTYLLKLTWKTKMLYLPPSRIFNLNSISQKTNTFLILVSSQFVKQLISNAIW